MFCLSLWQSLPGMLLLGLVESSTGDAGSGGIIFIVMFILGIAYLVFLDMANI